MRLHGRKFAAYRDDEGPVTMFTRLRISNASSMDVGPIVLGLPATALRFHATGAVLGGPAAEPLEQVDIAKLQETVRPGTTVVTHSFGKFGPQTF